MSQHKIVPMQTSGVQYLIERTYREGGRYQWVRELLVNALEAGAKRVEFGIDWAAVEKLGVYRRVVMDDGVGMTPDQMTRYFNTFGAGGKAIGGLHENFGVGSKTSLLPWNKAGLVVLSWVDGEGSMIWIQRDPETEQYGLRLFEARDEESGEVTLEAVVEPFGEWAALKPPWLDRHGTVVVLLGDDPKQDTMLGDPHREEQDLKGIAAYLNRRVWEVPADVEVIVEEVRSSDRASWARKPTEAYGPEPVKGPDRRVNRRTISGARYYIQYHDNFKKGRLGASGMIPMKDGTKMHWFLWEGERPGVQSYAAFLGYVATLYRNELYDVTSHLAVYRSFGVTAPEVRSKLWLIAEPREGEENAVGGVYPRTDRNALLLRGEGNAGEPLPVHTWAAEFADQMPDAIREALRKARGQETGGVDDDAWRARLAERLGTRWRIDRMRVAVASDEEAESTVNPTQLGSLPAAPKAKRKRQHQERDAESSGGLRGTLVLGPEGGVQPAAKVRVAGGIPTYRIVGPEEVEPGMIASWMANDPGHPEGVVLLNGEHPVIQQQMAYFSAQYPDHVAPDVEREVVAIYGQIACARVAHSEKMRGLLPSPTVDNELRSDASLTMSLLGLLAEESLISSKLGARYGRRRHVEVQAPEPVEERPRGPVAQA